MQKLNNKIQELNIDILNQKIKDIIKDRGLTQEEVADKINMSQPNFSKAINNKDGKCFTLNQICMLSQFFEISIDELTGNNNRRTGKKEIASMIARWVTDETAKFFPLSIDENIYIPISQTYDDVMTETKNTKYQALYFPNYWQPKDKLDAFDEPDETYYDAIYNGNFTDNALLNVFLDKLKTITDAYFEETLDKDDIETLIKKYIEQI